jgi:hypothetical protein
MSSHEESPCAENLDSRVRSGGVEQSPQDQESMDMQAAGLLLDLIEIAAATLELMENAPSHYMKTARADRPV